MALIPDTEVGAAGAAAVKVVQAREQRLTLQHAALAAAIGISALAVGMYSKPWVWPRAESGPAWSFERETAVPADTFERWVLTVRELPDGKPAVFPKDGKKLSVKRDQALRFSSTDLGGNLRIVIRRGSRERTVNLSQAAVARKDAYYLNVDGDAAIFFPMERRCTLTIDILRKSAGELEKEIIARKGTIHSVH